MSSENYQKDATGNIEKANHQAGNAPLLQAAAKPNDEYYTRLEDIEKELVNYKQHFKDKVVYCNCDDPYESNFFKYFALKFKELGLNKLIATSYNGSPIAGSELSLFPENESATDRKAYKIELTELSDQNNDGALDLDDIAILLQKPGVVTELKGNGDFQSDECKALLKEADIVVTNPPFSLFREYVAQLIEFEKKFLILGNTNAVTYKDIFPLLASDKIWLGCTFGNRKFIVPDRVELPPKLLKKIKTEDGIRYVNMGNTYWYTNLEHNGHQEELILTQRYRPERYPKYDNYDAINVNYVNQIPCDYDGVMGVPISFMQKYNPKQFEIVGFRKGTDGKDLVFPLREREREKTTILQNTYPTQQLNGLMNNPRDTMINGKSKYARILIRKIPSMM